MQLFRSSTIYLLKKNFCLFWRNWAQALTVILIPLFFMCMLQIVRVKTYKTTRNTTSSWDSFSLTYVPSPEPPRNSWLIAFAPNQSDNINLMERTSKLLKMKSLGFENEDQIVEYIQKNKDQVVQTIGAVIFPISASLNSWNYTIRLLSTFDWNTKSLFKTFPSIGPRTDSIFASPPKYYESGFLAIQYALDQTIIALNCPNVTTNFLDFQLHLKRLPYPPFVADQFTFVIQRYLALILILGFMFPCLYAVRLVLVEKSQHMKELLKTLGLNECTYWLSWFLTDLVIVLLISLLLTGFLCIPFSKNGPLLDYSDPVLILLCLFLYGLSMVAFGFCLSTLFNSAHTGVAVLCAIFIIISLPYPLLERHYSELSLCFKLFSCILPSLGMGLLCLLVGRYEGAGLGAQFSHFFQVASPDDNLTLFAVCTMFVVDIILYMLLTLYISLVWPGTYGVAKPWYYPFVCRRSTTWSVFRVNPPTSILANDILNVPSEDSQPANEGSSSEPLIQSTLNKSFQSSSSSLSPQASDDAVQNPMVQPPTDLSQGYYETDPVHLSIGIEIKHLYKHYSTRQSQTMAVSNLNMNIYESQITVLLGHNGAGKTTTLSMLTGLFPPSSGTALINGHDICTDLEGVRSSLGYCPQIDILYDNLTVEEHLNLFGRIKGLKGANLNDQVEHTLEKINLGKKRACYAKTLSGGMKRRLSIGMALIGNVKVLILDEPTSGLDPEARRQIWDILQAERPLRTVLVTTHYMDEADFLGDRIAILVGGKLQCYGSPLFLKAKYSAGYLLSIVKQSSQPSEPILAEIHHHIPDAAIRNDLDGELKLLLPLDAVSRFGKLFSVLESRKMELGISTFGVSVTTMEEVFFRVSEQIDDPSTTPAKRVEKRRHRSSHLFYDNPLSDVDDTETVISSCTSNDLYQLRNHESAFYWQQFTALLYKRYLFSKRNLLFTLSQLFIPILFTLIAILVFRYLMSSEWQTEPSLLLSLDPFHKQVISTMSYKEANPSTKEFMNIYSNELIQSGNRIDVINESFNYEKYIIDNVAIPNLFDYRNKYIVGLTSHPTLTEHNHTISLTAYFQGEALHAGSVTLNTVSNTLLRFLGQYPSPNQSYCPELQQPVKIFTFNHPLPKTNKERALNLDDIDSVIKYLLPGFPLSTNLLLAVSYLGACFGLFPIYENFTKAKHLQFTSGVKLFTYWLSTYVWDLMICCLVIASILILFALFNLAQFAVGERLHILMYLFILFILAVLPQMYLLSPWFKSPTSGLVWLTALNIFVATIGLLLAGFLSLPIIHRQDLSFIVIYFWLSFSPSFCFANGIFTLFANYQLRSLCDTDFMRLVCKLGSRLPCCLDNCGDICAYWTPNDLTFEKGAIGANLLALAVQSIVFTTLAFFQDSSLLRRFKSNIIAYCSRISIRFRRFDSFDDLDMAAFEDVDVRQHRHLIESAPTFRLKEEACLALCRVNKSYGSFWPKQQKKIRAVNQLSLAILPYECFGLLGVNGAGKTTLFRLITGDLEPSSGDIFVNGFDLNQDLRKAQQSIGYCPQFDALLPYLTGRETLQFYARLRGLQEGILNAEVDQLLRDLHLTSSADVLVQCFSGGKKRKLSVAVALVGGTPLVCLDEPTTGVDPISRRRIWNLLMKYRRQGRTLVLSSHSMEECEVLCSRVSVIANGRIRGLGTCQHLKARFGHGYSMVLLVTAQPLTSIDSADTSFDLQQQQLPLILQSGSSNQMEQTHRSRLDEAVARVSQFVESNFPSARLIDRHQGVLQYHLLDTSNDPIDLSCIFNVMEANKTDLGLVNYSVNQTSLEQIFLSLAKIQESSSNPEIRSN